MTVKILCFLPSALGYWDQYMFLNFSQKILNLYFYFIAILSFSSIVHGIFQLIKQKLIFFYISYNLSI